MRRFFSFVMCISGLSLAISASQADERLEPPLAGDSAANPEAPQPQSETAESPAAAAGELNQTPARRTDSHAQSFGMSRETMVRRLNRQLERFRALAQEIPNRYSGEALDNARRQVQRQIERVETQLNDFASSEARPPASSDIEETPYPEAAAGESTPASESADAADDRGHDPISESSADRRDQDERIRHWTRFYRREFGDDEYSAEMTKSHIEKLERLLEESGRLPEQFSGKTLEHARAQLDQQIAQVEQWLREAEAHSRQEVEQTPERRGGDGAAREQLRAMKEMKEKRQRAASREALQRRIDEAVATEYGARGKSARPETDRDAASRLHYLRTAIRHLYAAGIGDQADEIEQAAAELEAKVERDRTLHQAWQRAAGERRADDVPERRDERRRRERTTDRREAGPDDEIRELSRQVGLLRRELRRLRADVDKLRRQPAGPSTDKNLRDGQSQ